MARGHQDTKGPRDDGTSRLFCTDGPFGTDFTPNVLLYAGDGDWAGDGLFREGSIGPGGTSADFAVEAWIKRNYPDSIDNWRTAAADATGYCCSGNDPVVTGYPGGGFWFRGANFEAFYSQTNAASLVTVTGVLPFGWNHVAVNFVRGGVFTLWINGVSQGTGACGSGALSLGGQVAGCGGQVAAAAASGKLHPPYRVAAYAVHLTTLPTAAEYQTAVEQVTLTETAGTNTRLFMSDTEMMTNATHPASDPANADEGDWSWVAPTDTQIEEYPSDMDMYECTETYAASDTTEDSTIYSGAVTFAQAGNNMDLWYQRVLNEGTTFRADTVVFGDDPSWPPPGGVREKGYA